ncbi:hypothetical protein A2118_01200 [Candidatus Kaiserbacteria bacterium GWA2_50_9]|uniref:SHS2 domain-containing protein n=1 Tax=Candidatus Kaiserbacteria bacterium GWA2_50_9 TaxID=1798474 RepID=A0A1F6BTS8_9BACT|nr:MAG: hypothetical protein A2118_01200 [Candidatus Kaiserbacteria bacterium GWA2_50_9]
MSFLNNLFGGEKRAESAVLIDVGAESVAGTYVCAIGDALPQVLYTRRFPVEAREGEAQAVAMLRALKLLGDTLVSEGAPVLARATGIGSTDSILVSIDAPWQKMSVRTERFEQKMPFTFTKHMVLSALQKVENALPGQILTDESIIGTVLNGYETHEPYGKLVHRASVSVLASYIDERIAKDVRATLQSLYHTKKMILIAGSSLHCQAIQTVFPHERDALILDAIGPLTSVALIRRGLLTDVVETSGRTASAAAWLKEVSAEFAKLAEQFPLPRTIFLLAPESKGSSLKEVLGTTNFGKLWLSDNPPKIVPVAGSHLSAFVRQAATAPPDLPLLLMALYFQQQRTGDAL